MSRFELSDNSYTVRFDPENSLLQLGGEGQRKIVLRHIDGPYYEAEIEAVCHRIIMIRVNDMMHIHADGRHWVVQYQPDYAGGADSGDAAAAIAPMPGTVISTHVSIGDVVAAGDALLTIESMKLQSTIRAERDSVVKTLRFAGSDTFEKGALLVEFES